MVSGGTLVATSAYALPGGTRPTAQTSLWTSAANGNWSNSSNWTGGVPNGVGVGATFIVPTSSAVTVTLDTPVTLGSLQFGNSASASVGYTLRGSGSNTLTLNNSGNGATIIVTETACYVTRSKHQLLLVAFLKLATFVTSTVASKWHSGGYLWHRHPELLHHDPEQVGIRHRRTIGQNRLRGQEHGVLRGIDRRGAV